MLTLQEPQVRIELTTASRAIRPRVGVLTGNSPVVGEIRPASDPKRGRTARANDIYTTFDGATKGERTTPCLAVRRGWTEPMVLGPDGEAA